MTQCIIIDKIALQRRREIRRKTAKLQAKSANVNLYDVNNTKQSYRVEQLKKVG